ncbi:MAG TPA: ABC transporter permease [Gemmatimonadales bacterium]|nr:ABC transporter permease [Gemmatimonadales bacterium]
MISDSLRQLISVRFREFFREPEALFWVYGFPLLLAAGLGLAFRDRPADRIVVGRLPGVTSGAIEALRADSGIRLEAFPDSASGARALRNGQIALLLAPDSTGLRYRYDDTRPDARMARQRVNDVVQQSAGRSDQISTADQIVRERGSRYIDFLIPGLIGFNLMGSGIWGTGFTIVDARKRKLLKRLAATPMSRSEYLASFLLSQLVLLVLAVGILLLFGVLVFDVPVRGSFVTPRGHLRCGGPQLCGAGPLHRRPPPLGGSRVGTDEPRDAADVGVLRSVLLFEPLSGGHAAGHQGAAAHRDERRPSRHHARRCRAEGSVPRSRRAPGLASSFLRAGA